jgi:hypothetical protein
MKVQFVTGCMLCHSLHRADIWTIRKACRLAVAGVEGFKALCGFSADGVCCTATGVPVCIKTTNGHNQLVWEEYAKKQKGRTHCRELPLCAGSGEGCQWQALPSPVQCEETATRTRDLPVTGGKTLPLAPGPPYGKSMQRL